MWMRRGWRGGGVGVLLMRVIPVCRGELRRGRGWLWRMAGGGGSIIGGLDREGFVWFVACWVCMVGVYVECI